MFDVIKNFISKIRVKKYGPRREKRATSSFYLKHYVKKKIYIYIYKKKKKNKDTCAMLRTGGM